MSYACQYCNSVCDEVVKKYLNYRSQFHVCYAICYDDTCPFGQSNILEKANESKDRYFCPILDLDYNKEDAKQALKNTIQSKKDLEKAKTRAQKIIAERKERDKAILAYKPVDTMTAWHWALYSLVSFIVMLGAYSFFFI